MKLKQILFGLAICLTVLLSLTTEAMADVIKLRDGTVLRGKVVSFNQRRFTIIVKIGTTTSRHDIAVDDVESIEFEGGDTISSIAPSSGQPGGGRIPQSVSTEGVIGSAGTASPQSADRSAAADAAPNKAASAANKTSSDELIAIAEKTVSVAAAANWTSTEIRIQKGQHIVISASGEVDLGDGKRAGPEGTDGGDKDRLLPSRKVGALIAVIGDDNNEFEFVGASSEIVAKHSGILFLTVNDSEVNVRDNNGMFVARVRVLSNR
ncbi:MAG: hypothetical protein ACKVZH_09900 [Blastocatellia bacterium]